MKLFGNILCKSAIFLICISAWLPSASSERIDYCDSIPEDFASWNSSVSLPKFDPEMGTLTGVDITCSMNLSEQITVENLNSLPGNFSMSFSGALTAELPTSEEVAIPINYIKEGSLSGYDGAVDFGGTSGLNSTEKVPTDAVTRSISNLDAFLAGTPGENLTIPVKVKIKTQTIMPGNIESGYNSRARAEICLSYIYDVKTGEDGGIK